MQADELDTTSGGGLTDSSAAAERFALVVVAAARQVGLLHVVEILSGMAPGEGCLVAMERGGPWPLGTLLYPRLTCN